MTKLDSAKTEFEKADNMASRVADEGFLTPQEAAKWAARSQQHISRGLKLLVESLEGKA